MCKGAFPLDRAGTHLLPKLPEKQLCERFLAKKGMNSELLREHFNSMFLNFLDAMANKDYKTVERLTEKRFY